MKLRARGKLRDLSHLRHYLYRLPTLISKIAVVIWPMFLE